MDLRLRKHPLGFWEIFDKPSLNVLQQYYADKYYQEPRGSYEDKYTPEEKHYFQVKLEQRFAVIQRIIGKKIGNLLDVGCGEGYNLAFFRKIGWDVKGLDFSSEGVKE